MQWPISLLIDSRKRSCITVLLDSYKSKPDPIMWFLPLDSFHALALAILLHNTVCKCTGEKRVCLDLR